MKNIVLKCIIISWSGTLQLSMGPTKYRTSDDLWRTRSCMVGGGVLPVITTAPAVSFMIAQCTGTPSTAQPHRDDWPWAQLQRGDASRFLSPSVCFLPTAHTGAGALAQTSTHTRTRTLLRRALCFGTYCRGFSLNLSLRILELVRIHQSRTTDG